MAIGHIPVLLCPAANRDEDLIGRGELTDSGELVIVVKQEDLVDKIEHLATTGDIRELYLCLGYTFTTPVGPVKVD